MKFATFPGRKTHCSRWTFAATPTKLELAEAEADPDIEDFILAELNCLRVSPVSIHQETLVLQDGYSDLSRKIITYLTKLRKPSEMNSKEFNTFEKQAFTFKVQDQHLFRRNSKNVPMRRVIDRLVERQTILQKLHDESGHKGRESRYSSRMEEPLHPTWVALVGSRRETYHRFYITRFLLDIAPAPPVLSISHPPTPGISRLN